MNRLPTHKLPKFGQVVLFMTEDGTSIGCILDSQTIRNEGDTMKVTMELSGFVEIDVADRAKQIEAKKNPIMLGGVNIAGGAMPDSVKQQVYAERKRKRNFDHGT